MKLRMLRPIRKCVFALGLLAAIPFAAIAQQKAPVLPATTLVSQAQERAKAEGKAVFIVFDASW